MRYHRLVSFLLLALMVFGFASAATAVESTEETTATTEAGALEFDMPAVSVPPPAADDAEAPWTTKFLIPTTLILGALAVFGTVVQYFLKVVRNRYKVVE